MAEDLLPIDRHVNVKSFLSLEWYRCRGAKLFAILQRRPDSRGVSRFYFTFSMWDIAEMQGTVHRHGTAAPTHALGDANLLPHVIASQT
jgi:hypothetical protein